MDNFTFRYSDLKVFWSELFNESDYVFGMAFEENKIKIEAAFADVFL